MATSEPVFVEGSKRLLGEHAWPALHSEVIQNATEGLKRYLLRFAVS